MFHVRGSCHHLEKRDRTVAAFRRQLEGRTTALGLGRKRTDSHLYRKPGGHARRVDLRALHEVISVDPARRVAEVEGLTTFYDLVEATLPWGLVPKVTPELRTITVGGAISGLGVESSSFRHGLVHETIREVDVLTASGELVRARPDNAHRDLFHGLPNSHGTLGYVLRAVVELVPAPRFVQLTHRTFHDLDAYFAALAEIVADPEVDFVDGVVFSTDHAVATLGRFVDRAPYTSDYVAGGIYHRSLRERHEDHLTTADYLWRWDRDSFWSTRRSPLELPWVRRSFGRHLLRSDRLFQIRKVRNPLRRLRDRLRGERREVIVQDAGVPIDRCAEFVRFVADEIGLAPMWICPVGHFGSGPWPLVPNRGPLSCDVGYYGTLRHTDPRMHPAHFQRLAERKLDELGAMKALYAPSFYTVDRFWELHDEDAYRALKRAWDPDAVFPDLYQKCVACD